MGKVSMGLSMSLDGFVAGHKDGPGSPPGESWERLFAWYSAGETEYALPGTEIVLRSSPQSAELFRKAHGETVVIVFHTDSGEVEGVDVTGLTVAVVADAPPAMAGGNRRVGMPMDAAASEGQANKLGAVFSG